MQTCFAATHLGANCARLEHFQVWAISPLAPEIKLHAHAQKKILPNFFQCVRKRNAIGADNSFSLALTLSLSRSLSLSLTLSPSLARSLSLSLPLSLFLPLTLSLFLPLARSLSLLFYSLPSARSGANFCHQPDLKQQTLDELRFPRKFQSTRLFSVNERENKLSCFYGCQQTSFCTDNKANQLDTLRDLATDRPNKRTD